ncbi:hypothetical protein PX699_03625 [Sphingobium sp. H39-3-25]|uniref:hypothetical protein n=1 Tax=Sphingobium arseniciresistens TaxID=3030834 RepID=UPI0023B9C485|nr:hypothetical protein [Sphingobium arseniciresistens]
MPKANSMNEFSNTPQPLTEPGAASAENGLVIWDGPEGIAITMTADAARKTGNSLISAAETAQRQVLGDGH